MQQIRRWPKRGNKKLIIGGWTLIPKLRVVFFCGMKRPLVPYRSSCNSLGDEARCLAKQAKACKARQSTPKHTTASQTKSSPIYISPPRQPTLQGRMYLPKQDSASTIHYMQSNMRTTCAKRRRNFESGIFDTNRGRADNRRRKQGGRVEYVMRRIY